MTREAPVLRLSKLHGDVLAALGQTAEAETALRQAQAVAESRGESPMLWRIHLAVSRLYQAQGRQAEAAAEFEVAQSIIEALAASIPDASIRDNFQRSVPIL